MSGPEVCVWVSLVQSRNCMSHKHMKRCSKFVESHLCTSRGWPKFHLTILGTFDLTNEVIQLAGGKA